MIQTMPNPLKLSRVGIGFNGRIQKHNWKNTKNTVIIKNYYRNRNLKI